MSAAVLLVLLVGALQARQGAAIECYMCTSLVTPACGDPMDATVVTPHTCTRATAVTFAHNVGAIARNVSKGMGFGDLFPPGGVANMVCHKWKVTDANTGKTVVVRSCIPEGSSASCSDAAHGETLFCEECKTDGCNGATSSRGHVTSAFAVALTLAVLRR